MVEIATSTTHSLLSIECIHWASLGDVAAIGAEASQKGEISIRRAGQRRLVQKGQLELKR